MIYQQCSGEVKQNGENILEKYISDVQQKEMFLLAWKFRKIQPIR
jgi:hypothetical protein